MRSYKQFRYRHAVEPAEKNAHIPRAYDNNWKLSCKKINIDWKLVNFLAEDRILEKKYYSSLLLRRPSSCVIDSNSVHSTTVLSAALWSPQNHLCVPNIYQFSSNTHLIVASWCHLYAVVTWWRYWTGNTGNNSLYFVSLVTETACGIPNSKFWKHIHSRKVDNRMFLLAGTTAHGTYLHVASTSLLQAN